MQLLRLLRPGVLLVVVLLIAATGCHDESGVHVLGLEIEGQRVLSTEEIRAVMTTTTGGVLPWSSRPPFNRETFQEDLVRIARLYEARGYPDARVSVVAADLNEKGDGIRLRIGIDEGEPIRIESIRLEGVDDLPADLQARLRANVPDAGGPRDRERLLEVVRVVRETLLDHGYAHAQVELNESPGAAPRTVALTVTATPGPVAVFGDITVVGNARIGEDVIRRQLTFRPDDVYRQRDIIRSERRLSSIQALQFANIDAPPPEGGTATRIPVTVTVAEDLLRRLELRAGYGTEDRVRAGIEWAHLNFGGGLRQFTAAARWSAIDRGASVGLVQPYLGRTGWSLETSASSWWRSEAIYTSDTTGGRVGLSRRFGERAMRFGARAPSDVLRVSYVIERLRYMVRPEVLEDVTNVDTLIALGLDPIDGRGRGTKGALAVEYERTATDNLANPSRGYSVSALWEEARPTLGGTFDYRKLTMEARGYVPLGGTVVAGRLRTGTIVAESDGDAPFSERFFLGGSTSLRGWGRFQVSPLRDGIPVGGRTMLDGSLELRVPVRGPLGAVAFVDAGNVWSGSLDATVSGLRTSAGAGIRYATPIGVVRTDIGVQLTPIDGLLIDGEPESRRWRLHLSIGQAF